MMVRLSPGLAGLVYEIAWDNFSVIGLAASCLGAFGQYWFFNQYCCEIVLDFVSFSPSPGCHCQIYAKRPCLATCSCIRHCLVGTFQWRMQVNSIRSMKFCFHQPCSPVAQVFNCIRQALQSHQRSNSPVLFCVTGRASRPKVGI